MRAVLHLVDTGLGCSLLDRAGTMVRIAPARRGLFFRIGDRARRHIAVTFYRPPEAKAVQQRH
jgi:hypothetical protein